MQRKTQMNKHSIVVLGLTCQKNGSNTWEEGSEGNAWAAQVGLPPVEM